MEQGGLFLSPEWVHEVTRTIQGARAQDEDFRKLTSGYSLNLAYVVNNLPLKLRGLYQEHEQVVVFVQLEKGTVRNLTIGAELPKGKIDFTLTSDYNVAKQIFTGEINAAIAFVNKVFKIEPMSRVYSRPKFSAKSIILGNKMLKFARQIPTTYAFEDGLPSEGL